MKSLTESLNWIDQQDGKGLDWPGSGSGPQCIDLSYYYVQYHSGQKLPPTPAAADLWDKLDLSKYGFARSDKPVAGAIAVWTRKVGAGFGHNALVRDVYADGTFRSLDQNYVNFNLDKGSPAAFVRHNTSNVAGYWVPQFAEQPAPVNLTPAAALPKLQTGPDEHKIEAGETFWGLEEQFAWTHGTLQQLNPGVDPRQLRVGQRIKIPIAASNKVTPTSAGHRYTIMPGDTFWGLEERNGWAHGTLEQLNPGVNPKTLQIRSEINIP